METELAFIFSSVVLIHIIFIHLIPDQPKNKTLDVYVMLNDYVS